MSITVDTVQLRFHIKPDYDQQQIQQLQSDLKQYTNGTVPSVYVTCYPITITDEANERNAGSSPMASGTTVPPGSTNIIHKLLD